MTVDREEWNLNTIRGILTLQRSHGQMTVDSKQDNYPNLPFIAMLQRSHGQMTVDSPEVSGTLTLYYLLQRSHGQMTVDSEDLLEWSLAIESASTEPRSNDRG